LSLRRRSKHLDVAWEALVRQGKWWRLRRSCLGKVCEPVWGWVRVRSLPERPQSWLRRLPLNIKVARE
jgi:hypothetical protein